MHKTPAAATQQHSGGFFHCRWCWCGQRAPNCRHYTGQLCTWTATARVGMCCYLRRGRTRKACIVACMCKVQAGCISSCMLCVIVSTAAACCSTLKSQYHQGIGVHNPHACPHMCTPTYTPTNPHLHLHPLLHIYIPTSLHPQLSISTDLYLDACRDLQDLGCAGILVINNCQTLDAKTKALGMSKEYKEGVLFMYVGGVLIGVGWGVVQRDCM